MANLTTTPRPNPDIPLSLVGLLHISSNITTFIFIHIASIVSISGCVFYRLWSVCGAPLGLDWNWDVYVDLLPEAEVDVRLKNLDFLLRAWI